MKHDVIIEAVEIIKSGGVIVYPTETVYGLGASIRNETAVGRVFEIKKRSTEEPISVAVSDYKMLHSIACLPAGVENFVRRFLPGPVTIILKKRASVPEILTAGSDFVGVRLPDHQVAQKIIKRAGPITSTSANVSGQKSPLSADEVGVTADLTVDGGRCKFAIESTVVDLVNKKILRAGALHEKVKEELENLKG
jgi:L-threonylcarbamoyladenylate synthase